MTYTLHHGDCLEVLATLPDCSVDAIVTDPPAGIAFMGKAWDRDKGGKTEWVRWMQSVAAQCLRVIKPGGHALVWAIPRTSHWTGDAWEEAGWQVRDKIYHVFGSGFPKSLDVSKAIDKAAGAQREVVGQAKRAQGRSEGWDRPWMQKQMQDSGSTVCKYGITSPATAEAKQWAGWGTALKPAAEEWWLFRRPLEGTVAANVLKHGTGAINVDGCRIGTDLIKGSRGEGGKHGRYGLIGAMDYEHTGRFPANFTHDGSDEVVALFPYTTSGSIEPHHKQNSESTKHSYEGGYKEKSLVSHGDSGSAARFFYCAKASQSDRDSGDVPNTHATVKSQDLMTYLCRLITPPGGTILDPFTGSGSTGKAAILEGFKFIGIEREAEYIEIAKARIDAAIKFRSEFLF